MKVLTSRKQFAFFLSGLLIGASMFLLVQANYTVQTDIENAVQVIKQIIVEDNSGDPIITLNTDGAGTAMFSGYVYFKDGLKVDGTAHVDGQIVSTKEIYALEAGIYGSGIYSDIYCERFGGSNPDCISFTELKNGGSGSFLIYSGDYYDSGTVDTILADYYTSGAVDNLLAAATGDMQTYADTHDDDSFLQLSGDYYTTGYLDDTFLKSEIRSKTGSNVAFYTGKVMVGDATENTPTEAFTVDGNIQASGAIIVSNIVTSDIVGGSTEGTSANITGAIVLSGGKFHGFNGRRWVQLDYEGTP